MNNINKNRVLGFIPVLEIVDPIGLDIEYFVVREGFSDNNKEQDDNKQPQYYQTTDGQQVLKKIAVFNIKVSMPCVVAKSVELLPNTKNPKYHIITEATHKSFKRLMEEKTEYKKAAAIVVIWKNLPIGSEKLT
ncbi:hypothetical protein DSO57_1008865 [Entomophthora muscae]|uniref:Uncharacterized protein n=1 Tax=Entomophthora muscae TaxID=34485 RepID=A0ACC2RY58_9FUNG|nr:hypothetical protein DSO57_1008865 [Entomophthora muscae]